MSILIALILLVLCLTHPMLLLGFATACLAMVSVRRPFDWKDMAIALVVGFLAVGLMYWNGDWQRLSAGYDSTYQEQ